MSVDCPSCNVALNLTAQNDHDALALVLVDAVRDKLAPSVSSSMQVQLYSVPDVVTNKADGVRLAEYAVDLISGERDVLAFDSIEGLKESLNQRGTTVCLKSDLGVRYVMALAENQPTEEFLTLDVHADDKINTESLDGIIAVYRNCRKHLFEKGFDALTGLSSRKALNDHLPRLMSSSLSSRRGGDNNKHYYFSFLDLDFFKRVNDEYGHLYGDEVLLMFGRLMRQFFRLDDLLYRYGGEEFCVIFKAESSDQAFAVLDRFRLAVEGFSFPHKIKMTVSIGFSVLQASDIPSKVVDRADKSVYFSKHHGRNQTRCYETLLQEGIFSESAEYQVMDVEIFAKD